LGCCFKPACGERRRGSLQTRRCSFPLFRSCVVSPIRCSCCDGSSCGTTARKPRKIRVMAPGLRGRGVPVSTGLGCERSLCHASQGHFFDTGKFGPSEPPLDLGPHRTIDEMAESSHPRLVRLRSLFVFLLVMLALSVAIWAAVYLLTVGGSGIANSPRPDTVCKATGISSRASEIAVIMAPEEAGDGSASAGNVVATGLLV
jgi:hypothetical protein